MEDIDELFRRSRELRAESDRLNLARHAPDITDAEYDRPGVLKREVDEEAFALEQRVRELEEADYPPDAISTVVEAPSLNGSF